MIRFLLAVALFVPLYQVNAKSLGVFGASFPVAEMSLLTLIESRVSDMGRKGELAKINEDFRRRASFHADRPEPALLKRALKTTVHYYSPEVRLENTLVNHQGMILYPAGTRVNALEKMPSYNPCWMFFDGDDKAQLKFIRQEMKRCPSPKLILTRGSVGEAEKALDAVVYFDQNARIIEKIKVGALPAVVTREGNRLKITEAYIGEDGHAF